MMVLTELEVSVFTFYLQKFWIIFCGLIALTILLSKCMEI